MASVHTATCAFAKRVFLSGSLIHIKTQLHNIIVSITLVLSVIKISSAFDNVT